MKLIRQIQVLYWTLVIQALILLLCDYGLSASLLDKKLSRQDDLLVDFSEEEGPDWVEEVFKIVQTNPEVAENSPDDTSNIAESAQQAAQEEEVQSVEEDFVSEGILENSEQVFTDIPSKAVMSPPVVITGPRVQSETVSEDNQLLEELSSRPLSQDFQKNQIFEEEVQDSGGIDVDGDTSLEKDGIASEEMKVITIGTPSDQDGVSTENSPSWQELAQRKQPQVRPEVNRSLLPYVTRQSIGNLSKYGKLALDADSRFMQFAEYHRTMMETIIQQWYNLAEEVKISSADSGSVVRLSFLLKSDGQIEGLTIEDSNARNIASIICKDAIASRVPFAPWNEQMVEILPQPFPLKISFYYR